MLLKRKYQKSLMTLVFVLFVIQACGGNASTVSSSKTPLIESETPSPTSRPSRTPRPAFTDTMAPEVAETAYYSTLQAVETDSIQTIVSTVEPAVLAQYPSLDGKWRVEVIRYECVNYSPEEMIAYEQLQLIDLSNGSEQVVADQRQNCGGLGAAGFEGLYWSPNNRYLYYSESREGAPDGMCGNYYVPSIHMLDTATGETSMVGGGHLSPDKTKLAMWDAPEHEIVIWDLNAGEIARVQAMAPGLSGYYIEDHSLNAYDYEPGLPIPVIQASLSEWEECKAMAEEVLATLHMP